MPYAPQQNGMAERLNGTIVETTHMFHHYNLEPKYWVEAIMIATYLKAKSLHKEVQGATLEELWSWKKPIVKHL
jgi:transposase InsO family protein